MEEKTAAAPFPSPWLSILQKQHETFLSTVAIEREAMPLFIPILNHASGVEEDLVFYQKYLAAWLTLSQDHLVFSTLGTLFVLINKTFPPNMQGPCLLVLAQHIERQNQLFVTIMQGILSPDAYSFCFTDADDDRFLDVLQHVFLLPDDPTFTVPILSKKELMQALSWIFAWRILPDTLFPTTQAFQELLRPGSPLFTDPGTLNRFLIYTSLATHSYFLFGETPILNLDGLFFRTLCYVVGYIGNVLCLAGRETTILWERFLFVKRNSANTKALELRYAFRREELTALTHFFALVVLYRYLRGRMYAYLHLCLRKVLKGKEEPYRP